jgi:hypothetical protein
VTIAGWLAVIALVAAPSAARAHSPDASRSWSDVTAVISAPTVHLSAPRRVEADSRSARRAGPHVIAALPAARPVATPLVAASSAAPPHFELAAAAPVASGYDATAPPLA